MSATHLFQEYASTPRDPRLGMNLESQIRKAWTGLLVTFVGAFVVGIPLSFVRFRSSRPWEPLDMLWAGAVLAVFSVPIAAVIVGIFRRYARLFRDGRLVEGRVIEQRPTGAVLQVATGLGPDRTFIPGLNAALGETLPVIIGDAMSSLALVVVARGEVRRGSLLTAQQLSQVPGA